MVAVKSEGKSEFVKDVLSKNSKANAQAVNDAWKAAGHAGTISTTLVQKMRAGMGLTSRRKPRKPAVASGAVKKTRLASSKIAPKRGRPKKATPTPITNGTHEGMAPVRPTKAAGGANDRRLAELEGEIDQLIFRLISLGGLPEVEETLRQARRLLIRSQKA